MRGMPEPPPEETPGAAVPTSRTAPFTDILFVPDIGVPRKMLPKEMGRGPGMT